MKKKPQKDMEREHNVGHQREGETEKERVKKRKRESDSDEGRQFIWTWLNSLC